jgi:hypothetical protein
VDRGGGSDSGQMSEVGMEQMFMEDVRMRRAEARRTSAIDDE